MHNVGAGGRQSVIHFSLGSSLSSITSSWLMSRPEADFSSVFVFYYELGREFGVIK